MKSDRISFFNNTTDYSGEYQLKSHAAPTLDDNSIYKPLEPTLQSRAKEAGTQARYILSRYN